MDLKVSFLSVEVVDQELALVWFGPAPDDWFGGVGY